MKNVTSILKDYFLGWGEEREICARVVFMEMGVGQERLGGKPGRSTTGLREACGEGGWARGGRSHGSAVRLRSSHGLGGLGGGSSPEGSKQTRGRHVRLYFVMRKLSGRGENGRRQTRRMAPGAELKPWQQEGGRGPLRDAHGGPSVGQRVKLIRRQGTLF